MMVIPPAMIEDINIKPNDTDTVDAMNGQLVSAPVKRGTHRTVAEIIAGINAQDIAEWRENMAGDFTSHPVGKEII